MRRSSGFMEPSVLCGKTQRRMGVAHVCMWLHFVVLSYVSFDVVKDCVVATGSRLLIHLFGSSTEHNVGIGQSTGTSVCDPRAR